MQGVGDIDQLSVDPGGHGLAREALTDGGSDIFGGTAFGDFFRGPVRKFDLNHAHDVLRE
jgi:hypothetical protein